MVSMLQPQAVDLLLKGGTFVTMDAERRVIENGALAIRAERIVALGPADEILPTVSPARVLDITGQVVTPGFINAHGHWAMTLFRGMVDDMPLEAWLNHIWKVEREYVSPENVKVGSQLAMVEMIRGGTTCAADMYWQFHHTTEAARQAGFRIVNGPSFTRIEGYQGNPSTGEEDALEYLDRYQNDPLVHLCVQAHSCYTTNPEMLELTRRITTERGLQFITHASESQGELALVREQYNQTPIEVLHSFGLLGERALLAHCVHLSDDEINLLAETKTSVAHCPSSNLKLASGIARVARMCEAGVNGPASNNDLDMLQEAQLAAMLQKGVTGDPTALPARDVFAMMTIQGAKAVGLGEQTGSLEAGKLADITVLDFDQPHLTPCYDLYSHLIYAAHQSDVRHVIIHGKPVMENRALLTLDEIEIKQRVCRLAEEINMKK
jgi:5-methylthioadenosine/S-adenosylhomocysteine deaminase